MESQELKDFEEKIKKLSRMPSKISLIELEKLGKIVIEAKHIVSIELPHIKPDELFDEILDLFCSGKVSQQQVQSLLDEYNEITLKRSS
jgi:DNA-binding ferritin-like protein (Dps family)